MTTPVVGVLAVLPSETANQLAGLASPVTSSAASATGCSNGPVPRSCGIGPFGPLYGLVAALLVAGCIALLLLRYRKVSES